ncbi:hypothetical protein A1O3_01647 [Capronia epimyces CBS 606.96]|uniref:Uncharacterized protein n=1 Tax=Capronia epimyces CBS 606.96 TaxID=1182542 RepID=W9YUZ9_9EURO|nr:uncharacterized protein A1O3_01647 [Capronia epimyces CBS 606.96]EXJ93091.1 hypothetical protein A1O3_01647 [Capronia epimyces CBS 606.96]
MSGIGEALAIVSCVAGLIQAYDAGSRIVKQIKARRLAHDALPPSDLLEESIEKGKREIEQVVADGKNRFGSSFEEGDTTAQLALYKITIATQNALLAGLTQARDDDGVIDFDTCIDTSDKGRVDALIALHALFQRKLEEEMERKKNAPSNQQEHSPPQHDVIQPSVVPAASGQSVAAPKPQQTPPPTPPLGKVKKSRTFTDVVFRRKEGNQQATMPTAMDTIPQVGRFDQSPRSSQQDMLPRSPRRNTGASTSSSATWSSAGSRNSTVGYEITSPGLPAPISRSDTGLSSITAVSRHNTALSMASSMSTASTISPITKYGGFCKNAYELREGLVKKGLTLAPVGVYGNVYRCTSSKCQFSGQAAKDKKGYRINDKVFTASSGLQYRWMFLAKSHMRQQVPLHPSFRCLVCLMLGDDSGVYDGHSALLAHVISHQGAYMADTRLEGPVTFTNGGVKMDMDEFDLRFPAAEKCHTPDPKADEGAAVMVAGRLPTEPHLGNMGPSQVEDVISYKVPTAFAYEADDNPWA